MSTVSSEIDVQLLLEHDQNRRLLAERLEAEYAVTETVPDDIPAASFDVCIVDARAFRRYREAVEAKKDRAAPAFLPVVLLTEAERLERLPGGVWDVVDEVLTTPLAPVELTHRLENLVERRRLSLDLERRKERSEQRFETLFETAPDPVVVTSPDGIVSDANDAFAQTVGEPRDALVGQSITDFEFSPVDTVERLLLQLAEDEDSPAGVEQLAVDSEETAILELNTDVITSLGEASERIGIFRDVTEREEREAKLREQNERLERFAARTAHDLRNPLTIAEGHLELAREGHGDEHFEEVAQSHARIEELVEEILTLARQGQLVVDPESISLRDAAQSAWTNVSTADVSLSVRSDATLLADDSRLLACFENLFRNAVEHGGSSVRVGAIDAGERCGFYVEDNGPGIPETDTDDVFEAGYTTAQKGTGFGLAIVRQIAEGHDWEVAAVQGTDGGARFEITGVEFVD